MLVVKKTLGMHRLQNLTLVRHIADMGDIAKPWTTEQLRRKSLSIKTLKTALRDAEASQIGLTDIIAQKDILLSIKNAIIARLQRALEADGFNDSDQRLNMPYLELPFRGSDVSTSEETYATLTPIPKSST